ncbi:MAG: class D sortase [Bryobacteraceae bacterium]
MKVRIHWVRNPKRSGSRRKLRQILRWTERFLIAAACLILGFCAWIFVNAARFQTEEAQQFKRLIPRTARSLPSPPVLLQEGAAFSKLDIPSAGISVIVAEGVTDNTLQRAVGHVPGTALPGEAGNVGIAGHRDTFFRALRNVKAEDRVSLTTAHGTFEYFVEWVKIVDPEDVGVLASTEEPVLTLVTCYPFYYVGAAPHRYIVRARLEQPYSALAIEK